MDTPDYTDRFFREIPEGDNRVRMVCRDCGFIHYENPRIVVAAVATADDRILLCRRAIPPRRGFWTVPGGFMENDETAMEAAIRETLEETGAGVEIRDLLGIYSLPHIGQVHLVYRAKLTSSRIEVGPECLDARLFGVDEIPWDELAFPTNTWALQHHLETLDEDPVVPRTEPAGGF
jgi:ADP-ribose pyrophosphatase YjhB (NUDIX family)